MLAAISALSPEKTILYMRKILKEDNAALIANGNFEIEVSYTSTNDICIAENYFINNLIATGRICDSNLRESKFDIIIASILR